MVSNTIIEEVVQLVKIIYFSFNFTYVPIVSLIWSCRVLQLRTDVNPLILGYEHTGVATRPPLLIHL